MSIEGRTGILPPPIPPGEAQAMGERALAWLGVALVLGLVGLGTYFSEDGHPVLGVALMIGGAMSLAVSGSYRDRQRERAPTLHWRVMLRPGSFRGWVLLAAIAAVAASSLLLAAGTISNAAALGIMALSAFAAHHTPSVRGRPERSA